jgi:uncharacterized protein YozE (UPF0346 family)
MKRVVAEEIKSLLPKYNDETYDFVSNKVVERIFEELLKAPKSIRLSWKDYPHLVGFNRWVVEQIERDDVIGNICRDLVHDMEWNFRSNSYEEMKKHLESKNPTIDNLKGFNIMYETYLSETSDFQKELEKIGEEEKVKQPRRSIVKKSGVRGKGNTGKGKARSAKTKG